MKGISLDLRKRLALVMGGILLVFALVNQSFFNRQERTHLEKRLQEKATFINTFYAFLIADSLQRKDDVTLSQVISRLEEDAEITSVIVVDQKGEIRYHNDPQKLGLVLDDPLVKGVLQSGEGGITPAVDSGGRALALVSPLKVQGQGPPIGAVRLQMTYRHIEDQISQSQNHFKYVVLGFLTTGVSFFLFFVQAWVLAPLHRLQNSLGMINPAALEANLPETPDEFGQVNKSLNDLILRFKNEWQGQMSDSSNRAEQEKSWVLQMTRSFLPESRVIVADKDNQVLSDTQEGAGQLEGPPRHLLDLITDSHFATLVTDAFQKEGEVVRGPITIEEKTYTTTILSIPAAQSVLIKTIVALQIT